MNRSHSPVISAEALANQLSGSLPLYIGPDDVNKYPKLSHLLEDLSHRLTPTGVHKTTNTQFTHAMHSMKYARQKYLEEATLYRLTHSVLCEESTNKEKETKDMKEMLEALIVSELQDHLKLVEHMSSEGSCESQLEALATNKQCTAFGITTEHLLARAEILMSDNHLKKFVKILEKRLEQEWIKIASFKDPKGFSEYDPDDVVIIAEDLESMKRQIAEERNKLVHLITQTDCLFQQVHVLLLEYGQVLKALMSKQRLSRYPSQHLTSCTLTVSVQLLKLKCIELEILVNTYTSKSVPALKLISSHLDERRTQTDEALTRLKHEMKSYSGLDPRFQDLLKEYVRLQEDIHFCRKSAQEYLK
ncbi:uncharacterized protein [Panulirus ornatus]|uniref:uncharacterized protein isoform X2 n=1 Tax=Panulirus ornatus TaxID=150431 RepID=UPI003A87A3DB